MNDAPECAGCEALRETAENEQEQAAPSAEKNGSDR